MSHNCTAIGRINVLEKRKLEGCLCRVPNRFYNQVWDILRRTPKGIWVRNQTLSQQPTINNMTHSELQFALHVENMLNHIERPEYRQLIVEVSTFVRFDRNITIKYWQRRSKFSRELTVHAVSDCKTALSWWIGLNYI